MFYIRRIEDGKYIQADMTENGNLNILNKIRVQRGIGNEVANELLIECIPEKKVAKYLRDHKYELVMRFNEVSKEELFIEDAKKI